MKIIQVSFKIEVADNIDIEDIKEWTRFELHDNGHIQGDNPLIDNELKPISGTLKIGG